MDIQKISATRLNPAAYNPRKDLKPGDKEYEKLKRSIAEFGFVEPVIWNRQTGNVVGGHQRLKVLLDMGITDIDSLATVRASPLAFLLRLAQKLALLQLAPTSSPWTRSWICSILSALRIAATLCSS